MCLLPGQRLVDLKKKEEEAAQAHSSVLAV